jgi:hypothetical protein
LTMPKKLDSGMSMRIVEAVVVMLLGTALWRMYENHEANQKAITTLEAKVELMGKQLDLVFADAYGVERRQK